MRIWDKNYNSYAFEVRDLNGIPVLQVIMGDRNEILIGCSLYAQGIPLYATLTHGLSYLPTLSATNLQMLRDSTIFYYPSKDHLGELKSIPDYWTDPTNPTEKTYPSQQSTY